MIDHEWISIQGVIGRVFQIGRTRIAVLHRVLTFFFFYVSCVHFACVEDAQIYVLNQKKYPKWHFYSISIFL